MHFLALSLSVLAIRRRGISHCVCRYSCTFYIRAHITVLTICQSRIKPLGTPPYSLGASFLWGGGGVGAGFEGGGEKD